MPDPVLEPLVLCVVESDIDPVLLPVEELLKPLETVLLDGTLPENEGVADTHVDDDNVVDSESDIASEFVRVPESVFKTPADGVIVVDVVLEGVVDIVGAMLNVGVRDNDDRTVGVGSVSVSDGLVGVRRFVLLG